MNATISPEEKQKRKTETRRALKDAFAPALFIFCSIILISSAFRKPHLAEMIFFLVAGLFVGYVACLYLLLRPLTRQARQRDEQNKG
jgi:hypothetical protein